jgi:hypothetical protein
MRGNRDVRGRSISIRVRAHSAGHKPVTLARNRLDEPWPLDVFPQSGPNLANGSIDAVLSINKNILAPQSLDNLPPADDLPIFFQQQDEQLHGNALEFQRAIQTSQFKARGIQFKIAELVGGREHAILLTTWARNYTIDHIAIERQGDE